MNLSVSCMFCIYARRLAALLLINIFLLAVFAQYLREEHLSQGVHCSTASKKNVLCWDDRTPLRHEHSHTAANETLVYPLPCNRTETGIRSGHNRKCSIDYMKRTDSLVQMLLCEEVKAVIPQGGLVVFCSKALIMNEWSCLSAGL